MIVVLLLCVVQLSVAAVPKIREQEPMVISVGGVEDILYEIPEYEDPQLIDYIMTAMGGSPMMSLLQMAKKQPEDKEKFITPKEKHALAKELLDDVITRLQTIRTRLDKGNGNIHYADIEKSIEGLKKLERSFRPDIGHLLSTMRQSMSVSKPIFHGGILEVTTITGRPPMMPMSTKRPVFAPEPVPDVDPIPVIEPIPAVEPAPNFEPVSTQEPVVTEEPVASTTEEEVTIKPPYAMEVYKSQKTEYKKKFEGEEKPAYPGRWTWKSSSFV